MQELRGEEGGGLIIYHGLILRTIQVALLASFASATPPMLGFARYTHFTSNTVGQLPLL